MPVQRSAQVAQRKPVVVPVVPAVCSWPCGACAAVNDLALAACAACGTPFLAAARDARPTVVLPGVGDLLVLTSGQRAGLALCAVVAVLLITVLLALLPA